MIKFTAVYIILYLVVKWFAGVYVSGLSPLDTLRFGMKKYTKFEHWLLFVLGVMRILTVIFIAVSAVMLVFMLF